ncbi:MAG: hypothetical protein ACOZQL_16905, partial [Myxococcota bacterium]
ARAPARVCPSFAACAEACATADAGAQCYEASLFALEGATDGGRDLAAVARFAALACDQGEGRGCVRASRTDDALRALPSQCEAGQAEACELLVPLLEAADAGADAAARAARATQLLEAACAKPEPFACARLGSARLTGRLGPADVKGGVALLEQACTAGVAGACVELALELSRGRPPALEADPARALKFGRMARELSR